MAGRSDWTEELQRSLDAGERTKTVTVAVGTNRIEIPLNEFKKISRSVQRSDDVAVTEEDKKEKQPNKTPEELFYELQKEIKDNVLTIALFPERKNKDLAAGVCNCVGEDCGGQWTCPSYAAVKALLKHDKKWIPCKKIVGRLKETSESRQKRLEGLTELAVAFGVLRKRMEERVARDLSERNTVNDEPETRRKDLVKQKQRSSQQSAGGKLEARTKKETNMKPEKEEDEMTCDMSELGF